MIKSEVTIALSNESILVRQAKTDPAAFAAIYDHYFDRVYKYVRFRISDPHEADDLTSEIFERVLSRLDTYRPDRGVFAAWLFAIARNQINYSLRKKRWQRLFPVDFLIDKASRELDPGDSYNINETNKALLEAVGRLRRREQELIALKFASGLTNRAIARITGLEAGNVGVILHRAIKQLRADLEKQGIEP
jgi:RNA polymerase sigma-70 factor (TIGR02952 family)